MICLFRNLIIIFLLMSAISPTKASDTKKKPFILLQTINYPPLMGVKGGLMTDIVKESFAEEGIRIKYKIWPMARIIWGVINNRASAVVGSRAWFLNAEGADKLRPVRIYNTAFHFFYMKERFPQGITFTSIKELKKYRIGYIRGGGLTIVLKKADIKPKLVKELIQNIKKCFHGRIDMHVATELAGWGAVQDVYPDQTDKFTMIDKPILKIDGDIIFAENQKTLEETFRRGLKKIKKNGIYLQILKKYYRNRKIPPKTLQFINSSQ